MPHKLKSSIEHFLEAPSSEQKANQRVKKMAGKKQDQRKRQPSNGADEENEIYEMQALVDYKVDRGRELWRVRWKGYPPSADTYEPRENIIAPDGNIARQMADLKAKHEQAHPKKSVGRPSQRDRSGGTAGARGGRTSAASASASGRGVKRQSSGSRGRPPTVAKRAAPSTAQGGTQARKPGRPSTKAEPRSASSSSSSDASSSAEGSPPRSARALSADRDKGSRALDRSSSHSRDRAKAQAAPAAKMTRSSAGTQRLSHNALPSATRSADRRSASRGSASSRGVSVTHDEDDLEDAPFPHARASAGPRTSSPRKPMGACRVAHLTRSSTSDRIGDFEVALVYE